jgi:hypothetical protein
MSEGSRTLFFARTYSLEGLQLAVLMGFLPFVVFFLAMMLGLFSGGMRRQPCAVQEGRRHGFLLARDWRPSPFFCWKIC